MTACIENVSCGDWFGLMNGELNNLKSIMSEEKQLELMFLDVNEVILDAKSQLSSLMRWIVGLNAGIIFVSSSYDFKFEYYVFLTPIFITFFGILLCASLVFELRTHRETLADLRSIIGGKMVVLHGEFIDEFHKKKRSRRSLYRALRTWLEALVILVSGSFASIFTYFISN